MKRSIVTESEPFLPPPLPPLSSKTSNISLKSAKNRIQAGIFLWNKDMEKGSVCCFSFYRNLIPSGSRSGSWRSEEWGVRRRRKRKRKRKRWRREEASSESFWSSHPLEGQTHAISHTTFPFEYPKIAGVLFRLSHSEISELVIWERVNCTVGQFNTWLSCLTYKCPLYLHTLQITSGGKG